MASKPVHIDGRPESRKILLTGATGYVGGRLAPRLLRAGYKLRCLVRSPSKLDDRDWAHDPNVEIVACDLLEDENLAEHLRGCDVAYYLIHSMIAAGSDYAETDQRMAQRFAEAARDAELSRIIYLGGLGELGEGLSEHLRSRREVEDSLASTGVPVTVLRAAMIIGSGSASFEILRYLVERLPIMITPKWVKTECQPIGIRNVLGYLIDCLETSETIGETLDIGGPDVLSYRELMRIMAKELGLPRRIVIPVPVLTPRLSSAWIHLVTPLSHEIARPLAEGLRNRVVCRDDRAQQLMPQELLSVREAIDYAIGKMKRAEVETVWSASGVMPGDPDWAGGTVFEDRRTMQIDAPPWAIYRAVCRIGGGHGWYAADWLWRLRGWMDRIIGGPGLRRGRRDPQHVSYGEALDFWRVTGVTENRHLRLRAEMKLPGEAVLEFEINREHDERAELVQTARFRPRGLLGLAYWYSVLPFHHIVFNGMMRGIRNAAVEIAREPRSPAPVPTRS
ncbi:MAG: SDR family oxidoreductase [Phycisphaerales bacterium]|nr:MAG: SDR family oxidoreductase [Phycisphaerales bacterium]